MLAAAFVWLLLCTTVVYGGHEVLYKHIGQPSDLRPEELLIIQFDSRPLDSYWNTSSRWNKAYADKHKHKYMFLSSKVNCRYGPHLLADAWCKVKAMVLADKVAAQDPEVKALLYLDSDAVITVNYSMTTVLSYLQQDLHWDPIVKPFAVNQDGPGWSCKNAMKLGYTPCLNSGTVFWMRSSAATAILLDWWTSAGEPYLQTNKFTSPWRTKWPWEQAQLYEVHRRHAAQIMVLSFPDLPHLPWTSKDPKAQYPTEAVEPYCFSHWPGAGCFITHHCSSKNQKKKLQQMYDLPDQRVEFNVHFLEDIRS